MERRMSATQARINFGEVLRYVAEERQPVIVERAGTPHAVIIAIEEYEQLKKEQQQQLTLDTALRQTQVARALTRKELAGKQLPDIVDTIHQIREERDAELDNALDLRG